LTWIVVDNNSSDDSAHLARQLGAVVVELQSNHGFGRACNIGAATAGQVDWVAFVNPDVIWTTATLRAFLSHLPPGCAAACPLLVDEDGVPQRDLARESPRARQTLLLYLLGAAADRRADAVHRELLHSMDPLVDVAVTSGAFLAVRTRDFYSCGGFPDWLFLNYEDIYLCDQLRKLGKVVVDRSASFTHAKLASSSDVSTVARSAETARACSAYLAQKESVASWLVAAVGILCGFTLRCTIRHPRALRVLPSLVSVMMDEARSLRRGAPATAEARFIT